MKASELKIGNYVGEPVSPVTDLTIECNVNTFLLMQSGKIYNPIPLTEEWLLKFGFTPCESKIIGNPDILTIQISNNETLDYEEEEFFIAGVSSHKVVTIWNNPKHVHQLQNLYFALTGEELTIKEPAV